MSTTTSPAAQEIIAKLQQLSSDLYFQSESDFPLEVVHYTLEADKEILASIPEIAEQPQETTVETVNLQWFFRNMTSVSEEADETEKLIANRYSTLQAYLEVQLENVKVYRIGHRKIKAFILGFMATGECVGLKTTLIET